MSETAVIAESEVGFDFAGRVEELRCHETDWLRAHVDGLVREQRRLHVEELAARRVLDDRGAFGPMPDPSVSARTARADLETARALETLPQVAKAAHAGDLSTDQLHPLIELATPETDAEWARRAPNVPPVTLQRLARQRKEVTAAEAERRREARELRTWRESETGMAAGRWRLPDVDGVLVDKVLDHMAERMRPAKGEAWDSLAHRKVDALVELCRTYADVEPTGRFRVEIVNITTEDASPGVEVDGIPIAAETLQSLMPSATIRDCELDPNGCTRTVRKPRTALPKDVERHIRRRDRRCRVPGCEASRRLQIHHTDPICEAGDTHDVRKLAAVCPHHHQLLVPHGPYRLIGDAEDPDGLRLVHRDDPARDGPALQE